MKTKIQIKSIFGTLLFEHEKEDNSIKETLIEAVKNGADLRRADLRRADLRRADLRRADLGEADLREADLGGADLGGADLRGADLRRADLRRANLRRADLEEIKKDMFDVLLRAIPEIPNLKKAIIEGEIDGSTYQGECACLCGTLEKSANNDVSKKVYDCRDSSRPIERFFLAISPGDTPENSQFSKLALEWIEEFEGYIKQVDLFNKPTAKQ